MEVREYANKDYAALTTVFDSRFFYTQKENGGNNYGSRKSKTGFKCAG